jgi:hypothetical protein
MTAMDDGKGRLVFGVVEVEHGGRRGWVKEVWRKVSWGK